MDDEDPELICPILQVLVNKHGHGGASFPRDTVLTMAPIPKHDMGTAKDTFKFIRTSEEFLFVQNEGPERIILNNSYFPELADYLYCECDWSRFKIKNSLRHYDFIEGHEFNCEE